MTEFINDDNKEIERRKKDAKRAMYVLMMGSMLISALNIGKQLNAPKQVKSSDTTEAEFRKAWEPINEKNPVNITPMLLHSDSTKTVMMLDEP